MSHSFDTFVLLIKQFLLKYLFYHIPTFIIHTNIYVRKLVDSIYHLLEKQILQLLLAYEALVFYLMAGYRLN